MQDNLIVMPSVSARRPHRKKAETTRTPLVLAIIALLLSVFALVSSLDLRFSKASIPITNCVEK